MGNIIIKEIDYKEFGKCIEISNSKADLVVTVGLGPRIIRFGFTGGENEFAENFAASKAVGDDEWKVYGGHRLWHSPENDPRSYIPDNEAVEWTEIENGVKVTRKVEPWTQIKKEMEITLCPCSNNVKVVHRITNKNAWPVELSAWALSVMAPGGIQVIPQPKRDTGLLPNRALALWPYSKMNDHRINWGDKYIVFKQDPDTQAPFKLGISNEDGWAAYFNHGNLFVKRYTHYMDAKYPDFGVSYESYTNDFMMEMESLSPLTLLKPDDTLTHVEEWELIENVPAPSNDEPDIDNLINVNIKKVDLPR